MATGESVLLGKREGVALQLLCWGGGGLFHSFLGHASLQTEWEPNPMHDYSDCNQWALRPGFSRGCKAQ